MSWILNILLLLSWILFIKGFKMLKFLCYSVVLKISKLFQKNTFLINLSNLLYISLPIFRSNGCNHFRKIYTCIGRDSPRNVVKEWTLESAPCILPVLSDNFTLQYLWTTDLASKKLQRFNSYITHAKFKKIV